MRGVIATGLALLLAACSSSTTNAGPSAADAGTGTPTAVAKNLTCVALLQCAVACGEKDNACQNACFTRGTDDGQAKAQTLVDCLRANNCQDADCVQSHCSTEDKACLTVPAASGGKPIEGAAPTGSVPPEFVGTWKYTSGGRADDFTFNADGTASRAELETNSFSGCSNAVAFEAHGTVVFNAAKDGFTFYITTATNTSKACGQSTSSAGTVGAFDFTLEAIPALGPGKYWFFRVQDCPVTAEVDKRIQCGNEYDLAN